MAHWAMAMWQKHIVRWELEAIQGQFQHPWKHEQTYDARTPVPGNDTHQQ